MSGVGAIFELYQSYHDSVRSRKKKDEPKFEPEEEDIAEGYEDDESEWHYIIEQKDWDSLLELLQEYDFKVYNPKEEKKKRRLRVVKAAMWVKEKVRPTIEEEVPISPLLGLNERGQVPLHVAIINLAPDRYVIRMVFAERKQTMITDEDGRLPLHLATIHDRNIPVIDRLIRANFRQMQDVDEMGHTALWYAVQQAKIRQEDDTATVNNPLVVGSWGIPKNKAEAEWQERQEVNWSKVRFILLSYSTRRKLMVESERDVLLQALQFSCPPAVVEVAILAAQSMLRKDPTLASSALKLFMQKHYPIKNLQLLLHHFPESKVESLEAARKILSDHYHFGCLTPPNKSMSFREEMEKHALDDTYKRSLPCREWWDKIRCLLKLCGHANVKEKKKLFDNKYLLHAALSNCDTPPSLVQLLMVMSPESIKLCHPVNKSLLIHLICRNWKYNLFPQSLGLGVEREMEEPPMEQVLKIFLASDATLTRKRYDNGRLPLHHAIATGKSDEFLDGLVQVDRKSLAIRDPVTKLYPFQMAALCNMNKNAALWAQSFCVDENEWKSISADDRANAVEQICEMQELDQLTTVYSLLRKFPAAITSGAMLRRPAIFRDTKGKGMISAHYLILLFIRNADDNWVLQKDKLSFIHQAIHDGKVPHELEHWYNKLKFWIRYCYPGTETLPHGEEYLLHAAVSNSDTPPLIVELLLSLYPNSASLSVHGQALFPLHIAAMTPSYKPQYFELVETKNIFELLVAAYPDAATVQSPSGIPLDIARAQGKSPEDLSPLLKGAVRDYVMELEDDDEIDLTGGDGEDNQVPSLHIISDAELSETTTDHTDWFGN